MEALQRIIAKRRYNHYADIPNRLEPVFNVFCTVPDSGYRMREIRDIMNIPISTLYTWRGRVRQHPSWRPDLAQFTANPGAIEDTLEAKMAQSLRDNFISMRFDFSTYVLKPRGDQKVIIIAFGERIIFLGLIGLSALREATAVRSRLSARTTTHYLQGNESSRDVSPT
jgi:hypothetical protein